MPSSTRAAAAAPASAFALALALAALAPRAASAQRPDASNCTTRFFSNTVDHFSTEIPPENGGNSSWLQRVLVCDQFFSGVGSGAIFFYTGNEGDVTLYANNTGLMWENAAAFGAMLVFAEHRYYGQSWPLSGDPAASLRHMRFLSSQQALAELKHQLAEQQAKTDAQTKELAALRVETQNWQRAEEASSQQLQALLWEKQRRERSMQLSREALAQLDGERKEQKERQRLLQEQLALLKAEVSGVGSGSPLKTSSTQEQLQQLRDEMLGRQHEESEKLSELKHLRLEENLLLRSTQETDAELAKLRQDRQAAAERELARREQIESLAREKERRLAVEEQLEASVRALEQEKEEREMLELNKQKMLKRLASDNKMQLQRQRRQQAEVQQLEQQCQEQEASERSKRVLVQQVREDCVCVWYCRSWNPIRLPL